MMPVSSASSPVDAAGSIATTIRTKSGMFRWTGQRVSSISARDQRAPDTSSNISALSSCRPSRVPSYLRTICCRNAGARLARLSYVEPRVITVVASAISSIVAVEAKLGDDYEANDQGVKVADVPVINAYKSPPDRVPPSKPNFHKSYGYLRTPELSNVVRG